jgi:hypothetical protein
VVVVLLFEVFVRFEVVFVLSSVLVFVQHVLFDLELIADLENNSVPDKMGVLVRVHVPALV